LNDLIAFVFAKLSSGTGSEALSFLPPFAAGGGGGFFASFLASFLPPLALSSSVIA